MFLLKKKERIDNNSTVLHRTFKKKGISLFQITILQISLKPVIIVFITHQLGPVRTHTKTIWIDHEGTFCILWSDLSLSYSL